MAGYSGRSLPEKLGLQAQFRVALPKLPPQVYLDLQDALARCTMALRGRQLDFVLLSSKTQAELKRSFPCWAKRLAPTGMLWVAWPKKNSGERSDLDENKVRQIGLTTGLVDVKVCAISEVWSGLKFVIRVKDRRAIVGGVG